MEQFKKTMTADTIAAVATAPGIGGIAVIRVSGPEAINIIESAWKGKKMSEVPSHTVTLGRYIATDGTLLDEAVATVFRGPRSFTGEDVVELSVHGSRWIQREILSDLIRRGARTAEPGEFTQRAFLNGRIDLAQAEGVVDLIASNSRAAHRLAMTQTRGNFSKELDRLRDKLVEFASLLELELDFSEEDVEFADRSRLLELAATILAKVERLAESYSSGAALKEGLPVVIAGVPNAGKSSLLNLLLGDDKAIVTDIPGTTRDTIEDTVELDGILYRFIDTAGLRNSSDTVEAIGIDRARAKMRDARIVIWIIDPTSPLSPQLDELSAFRASKPDARIILLLNKSDLPASPQNNLSALSFLSSLSESSDWSDESESSERSDKSDSSAPSESFDKSDWSDPSDFSESSESSDSITPIMFSTKTTQGLSELRSRLSSQATEGFNPQEELMVTNARHYESLIRGAASLRRAIEGIEAGISADFIAQDVRETLHHLGTITGSVTTTDLLHSIFSRFCIGK